MFHRQRDSIETHLTIVFAALAISRHLQEQGGVSIKKLVRTLRLLRTVQIDIGGHTITAPPEITDEARDILHRLPAMTSSPRPSPARTGDSASTRQVVDAMTDLRSVFLQTAGAVPYQ